MRSLVLSLPSSPPLALPLPFLSPSLPPISHTTTKSPKYPKLSFKLHSHPTPTPTPTPVSVSVSETFDWHSKWYPVSPVCDLDPRAPHAKRVLGLDLVVWWDRSAGAWRVFDDRCPHRLAPLSEGRIDPWGRLQCVYHGWCFDGAAACRYIPQAPHDGPPIHTFKKACAAAYPSFVQNKMLWFWPRTDPEYKDIAEREKPPNVPELDDPSYTCTMGIRDLPYGYEVLVENLMDPAHVHYAHHGIMNIPKRPGPARPDREGGRPLDINVETMNVNGYISKQEFGSSKFIAPCLYYAYPSLDSNNGSVSSSSIQEKSSAKTNQKRRRVLLIFFCIPVSPGRSRVIWVFPRNFAVWIDQLVPRWIFHIGQNLILDSDLYLLHVEERKIAEAGPSNWQTACFVPTKSDAQVIAFRKWLRKYSYNKVDWGAKSNELLPPTPAREQLMDRYWTHVVNCSSCRIALKGLKALEVALQIISIFSIGIVAAAKENLLSAMTKTVVVSMALLCFLASKWLSQFIYKTFYYHDYNHAFR
ncbi:protochlorophyllide-dependent translocon component 52, chloroplastic [Iris pallida]|uniref:Protochlorophyllide-dependent translocon component 52, chloroplastic n=1 Tax=Iris pallida TaxID=29817 RepID=A0AAX6F330_IRIPA|nr:protochlorophyllide-dependent translocon component 52, chloroplastic [Iris pallida]